MHHSSCLSADKKCNNENIYISMVEYVENMTKSYNVSFLTFWLYYETNLIWIFGSQMVEF